ncbi:hypothetical protein J1N35_025467 [Gossypium stocksii]|uniref:Uncharacterized protein n=1 Tax=Gossypium stocksii TaxID=47602 RepID=A0A9D3V6K9_9ROSI|nr:hypothetical protein J1N35_025467 [Gossypium stocksii]
MVEFSLGKHVLNEPNKVQDSKDKFVEVEDGGQEVPAPPGTIPILKGMKARIVADLQASVDFGQKHYDKKRKKSKGHKEDY